MNDIIKAQANRLLYEYKLFDKLSKYNDTYLTGSYIMDLMTWNDLDLYVESIDMTMDKIYDIVAYIVKTFKPLWFEAKEGMDNEKTYYFIGFETMCLGELWNVDIRFISLEDIEKAETYCNNIAKKAKENTEIKTAIISIKNQLIKDGNYTHDPYSSIDVYDKIVNDGIRNIDNFYRSFE